MAVNKVEVNGETKLDLTQDTVTPENLLSGATAHNAAGERISGAVAPVRYDVAQNLTSEQQKQARDNIGAGDMLKSVYDPQGKNQDAFKYADDAVRDIPSQEADLVEVSELPVVTAADNGKFLRVVGGVWSAEAVLNANGVSF